MHMGSSCGLSHPSTQPCRGCHVLNCQSMPPNTRANQIVIKNTLPSKKDSSTSRLNKVCDQFIVHHLPPQRPPPTSRVTFARLIAMNMRSLRQDQRNKNSNFVEEVHQPKSGCASFPFQSNFQLSASELQNFSVNHESQFGVALACTHQEHFVIL